MSANRCPKCNKGSMQMPIYSCVFCGWTYREDERSAQELFDAPEMIAKTPDDRAKAVQLLEEVVDDGHDKANCWSMNSIGHSLERQFHKDPERIDKECDCHILLVKEALALLTKS